ncbi:hypothetical protein BDN70DRAFT_317239 [Pholiota conissans]|uniref:Uncharacterized protein n=1 Tax=Pholiota conissans TaxID=109636 RepID=A0A9P5ZAP9_9AGAR|nr:hypothetical protein BDN70DRAFT_317239 [Pholiota conissans]
MLTMVIDFYHNVAAVRRHLRYVHRGYSSVVYVSAFILHQTFPGVFTFARKNAPVKPASQELAIDRAIRVLLGSGSLTLLVAAADLIVYMKFKGNGMHLMLNLPLCKFFSSNVMNCLNSRHGYKIRWSSEINPHTLHGTQDVRPGDVIEFASITIKTTASMRSDDDDDDDAASDFRVQSRFNDAKAANLHSAARPGESGDSEDKKPRWSEG